MDCEKFQPLLLDELYEELDEVTSAAVKRHVAGCSRCAAELATMKGTRRLATLPLAPVPEGLEDRILLAVKEAQKVVPIQSRLSRAVSIAGSWAMRPQTAMAAVFLLMIGTSAFVIRSRHGGSMTPQAVSVTEQGQPAATAVAAADRDSLDSKAAAAAHGPNAPAPAPVTLPPVAVATAAQAAASAAPGNVGGALAFNDDRGDPYSAGPIDGMTGGHARRSDEGNLGGLGSSLAGKPAKDKAEAPKEEKLDRDNKKAPARTRAGNASNEPQGQAADLEIANAAPPAGAPKAAEYAPRAQSAPPPPPSPNNRAPSADPQDGFSAGMAAYRARSFAEATRQFDAAARTGDQNAALWAAKSVKDGNGGCGPAVPRFEAVIQKGNTWQGHESELEIARCQIAAGQLESAKEKLTKLAQVATHAQQAQQALNELNQVAQRREAERSKVTGSPGAAGRASPSPARAPAKPASAVDNHGF